MPATPSEKSPPGPSPTLRPDKVAALLTFFAADTIHRGQRGQSRLLANLPPGLRQPAQGLTRMARRLRVDPPTAPWRRFRVFGAFRGSARPLRFQGPGERRLQMRPWPSQAKRPLRPIRLETPTPRAPPAPDCRDTNLPAMASSLSRLQPLFFANPGDYFANSTQRVSRMTVTRIWPG